MPTSIDQLVAICQKYDAHFAIVGSVAERLLASKAFLKESKFSVEEAIAPLSDVDLEVPYFRTQQSVRTAIGRVLSDLLEGSPALRFHHFEIIPVPGDPSAVDGSGLVGNFKTEGGPRLFISGKGVDPDDRPRLITRSSGDTWLPEFLLRDLLFVARKDPDSGALQNCLEQLAKIGQEEIRKKVFATPGERFRLELAMLKYILYARQINGRNLRSLEFFRNWFEAWPNGSFKFMLANEEQLRSQVRAVVDPPQATGAGRVLRVALPDLKQESAHRARIKQKAAQLLEKEVLTQIQIGVPLSVALALDDRCCHHRDFTGGVTEALWKDGPDSPRPTTAALESEFDISFCPAAVTEHAGVVSLRLDTALLGRLSRLGSRRANVFAIGPKGT